MKAIILILTSLLVFEFANARQPIRPVLPDTPSIISDSDLELLPTYCLAVSKDENKSEIELELISEKVYKNFNTYVTYNVGSVFQRLGGDYAVTVRGVTLGLVFAGGGNQSWELEIANNEGTLTLYTNTFYGDSTQVYDAICE